MKSEWADEIICVTMYKLPCLTPTVTECLFCGETPERAFMTLSRCSGCNTVTYCSNRCQITHWKFHKAKCGKVKWNPRKKSCEKWDALV